MSELSERAEARLESTGAAPLARAEPPSTWRDLLRNGSFVALWLGQVIAQMGDPFRQMALQVFIYDVTGSAAALGALATITALPTLVLGPIAGVCVDRWDRRRIMVVSQALRAVLVLVLVLRPSIAAVYAVSVATAAIGLFYLPARNALLPRIVGRDALLLANSFSMTTATLAMMISPALASLVIGWRGVGAAFAVNSASFVGAAVAALAIRLPKGTPSVDGARDASRSWRSEIHEGAVFVARTPIVRGLLIVFGVQNIGFAAMPVLQIVYIDRVLGLPASALGYLMSFFAVGMLVGGALTASLGRRVPQTRLVIAASIGFGLLFIAMASTSWLPLVLLSVAAMGVCEATIGVAVPTLLQRTVPDDLRGRVFSVQNVLLTGVMVLGMGLTGAVAELVSVQAVLLGSGLIVLLGGLLGFLVLAEPGTLGSEARG